MESGKRVQGKTRGNAEEVIGFGPAAILSSARRIMATSRIPLLRNIKLWSRKTLSQLLSETGFRVVRFIGAGRMPFLWKSMIMIAWKPEEPGQ